MNAPYHIADTSEVFSPALIVFQEILENNVDQMIHIAGGAQPLRPHCKTHKIRQIAELQIAKGIVKHKCATFAEAEMLAAAGAKDIFLAYNLVGPNILRVVRFLQRYPEIRLLVAADHPTPLTQLGQAISRADLQIEVLLDLDPGLHRTGLPPGDKAKQLYHALAATQGLIPGGLHLYDGHNHQTPLDERRAAVTECWQAAAQFRDELQSDGLPVPRIVAGGTGSFPVYAQINQAQKFLGQIELSPGTCVFHDHGYGTIFPDMDFTPAAVILTRVISCPTADRITCDAGTKACASDPPFGSRLYFPDLPDAQQVIHNEEHLVLETPRAAEFSPGDELIAVPRHVCPTTALHKQVYVVHNQRLVDRWDVAARDRWLEI